MHSFRTVYLLIMAITLFFGIERSSAQTKPKVVVVPLGDTVMLQPQDGYQSVTALVPPIGQLISTDIQLSFSKLVTLATVNKNLDDTSLVINFSTNVLQNGSSLNFVHYELRASGTQALGGGGGAVVYQNAASHAESISMSGYFPSLAAGNYDIEVWIRGNSSRLLFNSGNFPTALRVAEIHPGESSLVIP